MPPSNSEMVHKESKVEAPIEPFDPFTPEFRANPYPFYHQQRAQSPILWRESEVYGSTGWDITGYTDAHDVLADRRFGRNISSVLPPDQLPPQPEAFQPLFRVLLHWLPMYNPPEHTRLQKVLQERFTRKYVESLQPNIEDIVNDFLDKVVPDGKMDFVTDFALPVPMAVMAKILGVSFDIYPQLCKWSAALLRIADIAPTPADLIQGTQTAQELYAYFQEVVEERRRQPKDDLITTLVQAEQQGRVVNEDEILASCAVMVMIGGETTGCLISSALLTLLQHPDQLEKLRTDPTIYHSAMEELLRYESSIQMTPRVAFEDVEISGKTIHKGERVNIWIGAVNRDPEQFPNPDTLDLARKPNAHLAFGHGIHACLGHALAHVELQAVFKVLLQRLSQIELQTDHIEWRDAVVNRSLVRLPISFS